MNIESIWANFVVIVGVTTNIKNAQIAYLQNLNSASDFISFIDVSSTYIGDTNYMTVASPDIASSAAETLSGVNNYVDASAPLNVLTIS